MNTTNTCEEHEVFDVVDVGKVKPDELLELCFCRRKVLKKNNLRIIMLTRRAGGRNDIIRQI